jgi:hypothetical protein
MSSHMFDYRIVLVRARQGLIVLDACDQSFCNFLWDGHLVGVC